MDYHFRSFAHQVVPKLVEQGIAVLAMKTMGSGIILRSNTVTPIECLHYALNLPTSVVITGMDSIERVDQAMEAARTFKPMSQQEVARLAAKTKQAAMNGEYELFKTSTRFDGTANNPKWMG
jgi:aryl-alcohol dehydrogenase-like predicted oxidoreductase